MDSPTHIVVIYNLAEVEMRRSGAMHIERAELVKAKLESNNIGPAIDVRIMDNPRWDSENNREKTDADLIEEQRRIVDGG